jgi:hypothetical protein
MALIVMACEKLDQRFGGIMAGVEYLSLIEFLNYPQLNCLK